jgi:hypothetical protein
MSASAGAVRFNNYALLCASGFGGLNEGVLAGGDFGGKHGKRMAVLRR